MIDRRTLAPAAVIALGLLVLGGLLVPDCAEASCQGQLLLPNGDVTKEIMAVTGTALAATATAERLAHEKTADELFGYATMVAMGRKELVECWRARVACEKYTPTPQIVGSYAEVPTYTPWPTFVDSDYKERTETPGVIR